MDKDQKNSGPFGSPMDTPVHGNEIEELYRRLQPAGRRNKGQNAEPVPAAVETTQQLSISMDAENAVNDMARDLAADQGVIVCTACGHKNRKGNKFCGMCGAIVMDIGSTAPATSTGKPNSQAMVPSPPSLVDQVAHQTSPSTAGNETHHYHHHYHHHFFNGSVDGIAPRAAEPAREDRMRPNAAMRGDMSRAEAAVRRITQEWVLACNTRHLDDLLELYVSDALVLRSNYPAIRGAAAVREFFFGALDAGLGEVEVEPLRVEVVGDLAYEAGRCKALVPSSSGKRREERGKYLWVFSRQSNGEWKLSADCWSSDLTLSMLESDIPQNTVVKTNQARKAL